MSRPSDPTKRDPITGEYLSRRRAWASYTKISQEEQPDGKIAPKLKVTLYLTPKDRRLMARLARREGLGRESHTAVVRRALEMALGVAAIGSK